MMARAGGREKVYAQKTKQLLLSHKQYCTVNFKLNYAFKEFNLF